MRNLLLTFINLVSLITMPNLKLDEMVSPNTGKITPKEKLLVKSVFDNKGDIVKAIKEVHGDYIEEHKSSALAESTQTKADIAQTILTRPHVERYMSNILDKAGLSEDSIAKGLKAIAKAGTTKEALKLAKPKDALSAYRMAAELHDSFPATRIDVKSTNLDIQLKAGSPEDLHSMLKELSEQTNKFLQSQTKELSPE